MQHSVVDDDLSRLAEEVYAEPAQTALGGSFFDDDLSRLAEEVYAEPVAAQHDSFGGDLALQARETLAAAPAPAQDDPLGPAILRGVQRAPAAIAEFMSDAATTLPGSLIKSGIEESRHYAPNSPAWIARQFPLTRPVAKFLPGYSEDELAPANLGMRSVMDAGADWLLAKGAANRKDIQDVRKAIDAGVPQYRQGKDFIDNPALLLNPAYLSEEALNAAGSMLPALGAAMAGGPLVGGMVGGSQEGLGALGQMLDDNMAPDEALVRSGAFGAASTALNALSFGKMLDKSVMDSLAQRGAKILASAGVEGFTEWLEGPVQALATTVGNLPVLKDGSTVAESARTGLAQARTDARPDDVVGAVTRAAREEAAVLPGAILTGGGINALTRAEDADGVIDLTDVVGAPAASFPPHAPSGPGAGTPSPRMGMRGQHDEVDLLAQPASSPAPPVPAARAVDAQAARLTDMDAPTQPFAPEPDAAPTDEDLDAVTRSLFSKPKSEVIDLTDVAQLPITVEQAPSQPFSTDEVRGMLPVWEQPTVTPMLEQPAPATLAPAPSAPEPSVSNAALESMDYDPFAEDGISADDAALVAIADELWPDEPAPATLAPEPSVSNAALEPVDYDPFAEDAISADDAALVAIADELWPDEPAPATLAPEPSVAPLAPDNAPSTEAVSPGRVGFSTFESPALPADQRTMEQAEASLVSQKADESDLRYLTRDTLERELDNVRYTHNKKPSKTRGLLVEQTAARLESFYKKNPDIERKQSPAHPADQRAMGQAGEVAAPGQRSAEGGAQKVAPRPLRSPSAALQSASDELRGASFWSDNPGGGWLSKEQDKARTERDDGYVSGSTTAGFKTVLLPVDAILSLPGQRGEESKLDSGQSDADIDAIAESMRASGYDKSEPIAVDVEFDGRTTIYEGNHRIRAAKRAGLTHVPVEIRYIAGGELVESPVSPERVLALVNAPVVKDSLTTETTGQSITHQEETPLGSLDISFENQDRAFSDQEPQGGTDERGEAGHVGGAGQRGFGFGGLGQSEPGGLRADVGRRDGESDGRGARGIAPSRIEIPGSSESVEYHVAEGSEVRASHDPLGDFDRRVDYPFVNERAYHKGGRERDKVVEHALDLKPSLLFEAPTAMDGAPVVDQNMNVLGGNSRAMSVQYAYAKSPANAAKYRAALEDWAGAKGLDVDAIRAMKQPILVRKLTEPVDAERAKKLIPALNEGFTQAVDPEAQGVSRGARISADSFDMLSAGLEDHDTLRDFLDSRGSKFFVDALVGDGAMDKTRLTAVYRNGELTKEGKAEIERMVRGAVVPDYELLDALPQSLLNALDKALPSLVRLRSRGEGWDIGPAMVLALRHVARFRNGNGKHLDMYFRTPEMFGEIEGKKNRVVQILAHALHHMGHAQFGKAAAEYARLAFASQPRTRMLPGMGQLLPTKSAALEKFRTPQTPEALFAATQAATQDQTEPDDEPGAPASDSEKPNDLAAPASSPNAERDEYVALFDEELAAHEAASRPAAPRTKPADVQRKEARDRAKATAKPGQSLSSAQKKMEAAARKMAKGAAQALDVFSKYGGLSVREVKDGDALDQNLYSELKPHLVTVMEGAREMGYAGKELAREVVRFLIKTFGAKAAQAKPYFMRFVDEEILTKGERNADDKFASQGVERDGRGRAEDGLGAGNVDAGRRGDSGRRGAGRGPAGQPGRGLDAGAGVSGRAPAAAGTGSDSAVRADAPGAARRAAGGELDQRGNPDRDRGLAPGSVGDGAVADAARASERRAELGRAEAPAGQTKGDLDNIAATLPSLLPGQHQDVAFAEKRFEKGAGVLFTNGTGTGKTGSGLGIVQRLVRAGKKNILIAAPSADIARAWVDFAKKFLGLTVTPLKSTKDAGSGVVVTTHANLGANAALATRQWDLLVMDEAHKLMSSEQAKDTRALDALRALGMHKNGARALARMRRPDLFQAWKDAPAQSDDFTKKQNEEIAATKKAWEDHMEAVRAEVAAAQGQNRARLDAPAEGRPGVVFLSATPFSYEFNVDYTEGFLFDYAEVDSSAYNSGDGRARFFMQHFGYRMRTGTLTKPDANVDSGLMQRQFNSWLKKEGALSLRLLDVAHDYDRKFVLVESAVGRTIDEGLDWLRADKRMGPLLDEINARFDHLSRRYLLEAIKAKEAVPLIRQNMDLGRKVVVFHDYKKGGGFNPFDVSHLLHSDKDVTYHAGGKQVTVRLGDLAKEFMDARPDLQRLPLQGLHSPLVTLSREFPDMLVLNGDIAAKDRATALEQFQADDSGKNLILVQSAAGEAGISLHDTTGRHQRVLINLGLPTRPVTAIQQEGRIFRVGQKSNAMFRYLNTGTNWERWAFASTIAGRASTAENLSLGEEARTLKEGFIQAFEESDAWAPGHEGEGTGGKERDASAAAALTAWDRAKTMYFGQQKKTSRTKSAEGADYFATPEPLGLKMVEWAGITPDMDVLEPSAGHGAIARWFPDLTRKTMIEPSHELASRLALVADGRIVSDRFEDHHAVNKYDAIIMNPPFGTAGKMAMEHVAKAFAHLRDGGRLVALIPRGSSMEKRFDAWHESEAAKDAHLRMSVDLPSVTFERAGTTVAARVVVIDKAEKPVGHVDARTPSEIGGATIGEFFDNLEGRTAPDRIVTEAAQAQAEIEEQERARGAFFDAVDTKHTKTGEPLYVARKSGLLSQDEYKRVAALAKGHGGWWSSFKGKGAVPGFQFKDRAKRAAFLKEAREMLAGSDPDVRMSRASVAPWPVGFPKAFSHTTVSKVTGHPDYDAAKAGNLDAARRLVADLVKPERLKELAERFPGAVVVPVEEVEAKGVNRIPYALAEAIAGHGLSMLGAPIYQTSTFKRKDLDAVARLKARKVFEGEVAAGRKYVLVDDILTQGGTVHELRTHIVNNGGEVVAVSSLAFSAGSNIIAIQQDTIDSIVSRFGRERTEQLLRDHNVTGTLEALTESEGRAIARFKSFDAFRTRLADEGRAFFSRVNQEALPAHQVRLDSPFSSPATGLDAMTVEGIVRAQAGNWAVAPGIHVVQSVADLPSPLLHAVRKAGAEGDVQALIQHGVVYLVADRMTSPDHVRRTILHEATLHHGLRLIMTDAERHRALDVAWQYRAVRDAATEIADTYGLDLAKRDERRVATEEVLAHWAEDGVEASALERFVAFVRRAIRRVLPGLKVSDAEVRDLIVRARQAVVTGKGVRRELVPGTPSMSRGGAVSDGTFAAADPYYKRSSAGITSSVSGLVRDLTKRPETLGRLKGMQTQLHKALTNEHFGRIWNRVNQRDMDVKTASARPAELAPDILPNLDAAGAGAMLKTAVGLGKTAKAADLRMAAKAMALGTLSGKDASPFSGRVFTDKELLAGVRVGADRVRLTKPQLALYHQGRRAIDQSLDEMAASEGWKLAETALQAGERVRQLVMDNPAMAGVMLGAMLKKQGAHITGRIKTLSTGLDVDAAKATTKRHAELNAVIKDAYKVALRRYKARAEKNGGELDLAKVEEAARAIRDRATAARDELVRENPNMDELADVVKELRTLEAQLSATQAVAEHVGAIFETANKLKAAGYYPLMRFGKYRVAVTVDGGIEHVERFESRIEANRRRRELQAATAHDPEASVSEVTVERETTDFQGVTPETAMLFAEFAGLGEGEAMQAWYREATGQRSALRRLLRRHGYSGYSEDMPRVMASFVLSNGKRAGHNYHDLAIGRMIADPSVPGDVADEARELVDYVDKPGEEAARFRSFLAFWYLLGSIKSAVVNGTQSLTMTWPRLAQEFGVLKAGALVGRGIAAQLGAAGADADLRDARQAARRNGTIDANEVHHLHQIAVRNMVAKIGNPALAQWLRAVAGIWSMPFAMVETLNRDIAFSAAYLGARDVKAANPEAYARRIVMETQGVYSKHNRPNMARGALAGSVLLFKQFPIAYLEMLARMNRSGRLGRRGAMLALAVMWSLAGWDELPFAKDLLDVADAILQIAGRNTLTRVVIEKAVREKSVAGLKAVLDEASATALGSAMADFINDGSASWMGVDLRGSVGMGHLIPGLGALKPSEQDKMGRLYETTGVAGAAVRDAIAGLSEAMHGDVGGAAMKLLPRAGRDMLKGADMAATGEIRDSKGRHVAEADLFDAALQGAGFQPPVKSRKLQAVRDINELAGFYEDAKSGFISDMAEALLRYDKAAAAGDAAAMAEWYARVLAAGSAMDEWNAKNPDYLILAKDVKTSLASKIGNVSLDPLVNALKNAPKSIREGLERNVVGGD